MHGWLRQGPVLSGGGGMLEIRRGDGRLSKFNKVVLDQYEKMKAKIKKKNVFEGQRKTSVH